EQYPPQIHAGKVGYGPHYAEVHGKETGFGAKLTGMKEQLKGKVTRDHKLEEQGKERMTGELVAKQRAEEDAKNPFKKQDEEGGDQKPGDDESKEAAEKAKAELKPGANKTDTEGPTAERIPSSTGASTVESRGTPASGARGTPRTKPQSAPATEAQRATFENQGTPASKSQDAPTTKPQGAPTATEQKPEDAAIRH
ncbi:hypothetical protein FRC11_002240, partial [Ceratobasidium sp. 423]